MKRRRSFHLGRILKILLLVLGFLYLLHLFSASSFAATGINRQINFQGKLVNPDGTNVADGNYTVVFKIYEDSSGGIALWTETDTVTTSNGIFQVELGATTLIPSNFNFNWSGLYLGIKIGSDAEMTPRVQLAAVPYAFNAEKVSGLTVQDENGNASTSGTLQIPNAKTVSFNGAFSFADTGGLTFQGSDNTTSMLTFHTGSHTLVDQDSSDTLTNKTIGSTGLTFSGAGTDITTGAGEDFTVTPNGTGNIVLSSDSDSGVRIGLSGNTPAALSVAGGIGSNALAIFNQNNNGNILAASASGTTKFVLDKSGNLSFAGGSSSLITITSSGVGQNTTLTIPSSVGATDTFCLVGVNNCTGGINYWDNTSSNGLTGVLTPRIATQDFLIGGTATTSANFAVLNNNSGTPIASVAGNFIVMPKTSGSNQLGGNIGIGTTNPGAVLDLQSSTLFTGNLMSLTGNKITTGKAINISATGLTTGSGISETLGSSLTNATGAGLNITGASFTPTNGNSASLVNLSLTNAGTSTTTVNGLNIAMTNNTSGAGTTTMNAINIPDATTTGCTNNCNYNAINIGLGSQTNPLDQEVGVNISLDDAQTNVSQGPNPIYGINVGIGANNLQVIDSGTSVADVNLAMPRVTGSGASVYGLDITPNAGNSAGTAYALRVENLTSSAATEYGLSIGTGWDRGFDVNSGGNMITSNNTNFALSVVGTKNGIGLVNLNGDGNQTLFTASSSGTTKFTIARDGTLTLTGGISIAGSVSDSSHCLVGGTTVSWGSCGGGASTNYWQLNGGTVSPFSLTADVLLGATATSSAKIRLAGSLTGGMAAAIINQTENQDIFSASSSGTTKFIVTNSGSISFTGGQTSALTTITSSNATSRTINIPSVGLNDTFCLVGAGNCGGTGTNYWQIGSGFVSPFSSTLDFGVGGSSTTSAAFAVTGIDSTSPVASLSAVANPSPQNGNGNGIVLSASTSTIQSLRGNSLTLGGSTTGNILMSPMNGTGHVSIVSTGANSASSAQLKIGYDSSTNYFTSAVGSAGAVTFNANGSGAGFIFNQSLSLGINGLTNGLLTFNSSAGGSSLANITTDSSKNLNLNAPGGNVVLNGTGDIVIDPQTANARVNLSSTGDFFVQSATTTFVDFTHGKLVGIGTTSPIAALHVTHPLSLGATGKALSIFDQIENQDILTASAAGATKFRLDNSGDLIFTGGGSKFITLANGGVSANSTISIPSFAGATDTFCLATLANCGGTNYWQLGSGAISPFSSTADVLVGGTATSSAKIRLAGSLTSGLAALIVNQTENQDILTASASGTTRFTVTNNGSISFTGGQTSALTTITSSNATSRTINIPSVGTNDTFCLVGAGNCGGTGTNFWQIGSGFVSPFSSTLDFGVGGSSTTSAAFAVTGIDSTSPVASLSAVANSSPQNGNGNGIVLSASTSTIQSLRGNSLTLGGSTTGNILMSPINGTGHVSIVSTGANSASSAQLKIGYDSSTNYFTSAVGSTGGVTFNANGSGAAFTFNQSLALGINGSSNGLLTFNSSAGGSSLANITTDSSKNLNLNAPGGNVVLNGTGDIVIDPQTANARVNLSSTGDFLIQRAGTTFATFTHNSGNAAFIINNASTGPNADLFTASQAGTTKFVIDKSGNVGIGTNLPGRLLDVQGNVNGSSNIRSNNISTGSSASSGIELGNLGATIQLNSSANTAYGGASSLNIANNFSSATAFFHGVAEDLRIGVFGSVGIGTSSPLSELHVTRALSRGANGTALAIFDQIENQDILTASASGTTKLVINNSGNIGIGISAPLYPVDISNSVAANSGIRIANTNSSFSQSVIFGATGTAAIKLNNSGDSSWGGANSLNIQTSSKLAFLTQSTIGVAAVIDNNQLLGLGTTSPSSELHVTRPLSFGATGKALAIFNQIESQDILTASAGGSTKFVLDNSGNIKSVNGAKWEPLTDGTSALQIANAAGTAFINFDSTNSRLGVGTPSGSLTPLYALSVSDQKQATASAFIENTYPNFGTATGGCTSTNCHTGLIIQLGVRGSNGNAGAQDRFINFQRGDGLIVGKIHGTGSTPAGATAGVVYSTAGGDFGEYFKKANASEDIPYGSLVCITDSGEVTKCNSGNTQIIGVASEMTGFVGRDDRDSDPGSVQVGLLGQVPIYMSTENGPIQAGDPLTYSKTKPGAAAKATGAGQIVGRAQVDYKREDGQRHDAFIQPTWYDPDVFVNNTDAYVLNHNTDGGTFSVSNTNTGQIIDRTAIYSEGTIANLSAGQITTNVLHTDSLDVSSDHITIAGKSLEEYISSLLPRGNSPQSSITISSSDFGSGLATVSAQTVRLDSLTPLSGKDITLNLTSDGKFIINGSSNSAAITFDSVGNASFSGTLTADKIRANQIELPQDAIKQALQAGGLQVLTDKVDQLASLVASSSAVLGASTAAELSFNSITADHVEGLDELVSKLVQKSLTGSIASSSASMPILADGLVVLGPSTFGQVSVTDSLSIANSLQFGSTSINVLGNDLEIQPLGQGGVTFLNGLVKIEQDGGLIASESAQFAKNVTIHGTATIGSLAFVKNEYKDLSDTESIASSSAGTSFIKKGQTKRIIDNPFVHSDSLIYVTPLDKTLGQVPYVSNQKTGKSFTVQIENQLDHDLHFNFLIANYDSDISDENGK